MTFDPQYEDMKVDPTGSIVKLAEFLHIDVTPELVQEIVDKTSFGSMKAKRKGNTHFRKGILHV